ncbi:LysR family transcriptional regulator [Bordetella genomosp. 12]|uniref:LysR family transcriptional regulator n=1 Tax=Bordetella genomosp. 12 TaxID=463035 RepID=A0A261VCE1_9BORD|nr:LysR family transcriptional regulator [Bordetella genomosp. 12]OZI71814.1 LysR family transcriptional regulator [Bordetella genomosp. 12]
MPGASYHDLLAFMAVARAKSFTRAAAQLGVSQSALSHTIRALETALGLRLLTRTTRSVAPTEAGERLLQNVAPRFEAIEAALLATGAASGKPAGTVRITATEHAARTVLWPRLARLLPRYPDIKVEVIVEARLVDIVAERYDMGVRSGDMVTGDTVAVRIGADLPVAIVAAPDYLARHPAPRSPRDLTRHTCINLHLMSQGGRYAWELAKGKRRVNAHVDGQLVFSEPSQIVDAALAGFGLGYVLEDMVRPYLARGRLVRVLADWSPVFPGYHLYYPSRGAPSPAMAVLIDALRVPDGAP